MLGWPKVLPELNPSIRRWPGSVYVMYITRVRLYMPWIRELDRLLRPVYRLSVDGGEIMKILKVK